MQTPTHEQIAQLANELWRAKGCPDGEADEDWKRAEEILTNPSKRNMWMRVVAAENVDDATRSAKNH